MSKPEDLIRGLRASLAKALAATEELASTINAIEDPTVKQRFQKRVQKLKGTLVQSAAREGA